jgi:hypothetical protein
MLRYFTSSAVTDLRIKKRRSATTSFSAWHNGDCPFSHGTILEFFCVKGMMKEPTRFRDDRFNAVRPQVLALVNELDRYFSYDLPQPAVGGQVHGAIDWHNANQGRPRSRVRG